MKRKLKYSKSEGLPGGPNEMFTYVTGVFSTEGYKRNSPDVNNPYNIIPSGNITMEDVDFPVMGIDNTGHRKLMKPGKNYKFPGNSVLEIPMAQQGGQTDRFIFPRPNDKYTKPEFNYTPSRLPKSRLEAEEMMASGEMYYETPDEREAREKAEREALLKAYEERRNNPDYNSIKGLPGESIADIMYNEAAPLDVMFRVSQENNLFDDYINPAVMIGSMAKSLGQAPKLAKESESVMPYVVGLGMPLATGALANVGAKGVKQFTNNLVNPLAGINVSSDNLAKSLLGTYSFAKELSGEIIKGKANKEAIKKGNEWLKNWIEHPATKNKINSSVNEKIDNAINYANYLDPEDLDQIKEVYKTIDNYNLIKNQSKTFTPDTKEYPLSKQFYENLKSYTSKYTPGHIHQGNAGVSYKHAYSPSERAAIEKGIVIPYDRYGSWVSRSPLMSQSDRISTTIHEATHDWLSPQALNASGIRNTALKNMNPNIRKSLTEWETHRMLGENPFKEMGREKAFQAYLADPAEQHARIMELRKQFNINPDDLIDREKAEFILNKIKNKKTKINPKFLNVIDNDPEKLANLFNKFWAVPGIVSAGAALQEYQKGGETKIRYTNNPNDPRLHAYQDSMALYNISELQSEMFGKDYSDTNILDSDLKALYDEYINKKPGSELDEEMTDKYRAFYEQAKKLKTDRIYLPERGSSDPSHATIKPTAVYTESSPEDSDILQALTFGMMYNTKNFSYPHPKERVVLGNKPKDLYVESENDPRYKSYKDSLDLYNYYLLQKQLEKPEYLKELSFYDSNFTDKSRFTPEAKEASKKLRQASLDIVNNNDDISYGLPYFPGGHKTLADYDKSGGSYDINHPDIKPSRYWKGFAYNADYSNVEPLQKVIVGTPPSNYVELQKKTITEKPKTSSTPLVLKQNPVEEQKQITKSQVKELPLLEGENRIKSDYPNVNIIIKNNTPVFFENSKGERIPYGQKFNSQWQYKKQEGGEINLYKKYVNGELNNDFENKQAEKVYNKLNRVYLNHAKEKGMNPTNYIMTYL